MEFANSVWTPSLQQDILRLELIQRKATRRQATVSWQANYDES